MKKGALITFIHPAFEEKVLGIILNVKTRKGFKLNKKPLTHYCIAAKREIIWIWNDPSYQICIIE